MALQITWKRSFSTSTIRVTLSIVSKEPKKREESQRCIPLKWEASTMLTRWVWGVDQRLLTRIRRTPEGRAGEQVGPADGEGSNQACIPTLSLRIPTMTRMRKTKMSQRKRKMTRMKTTCQCRKEKEKQALSTMNNNNLVTRTSLIMLQVDWSRYPFAGLKIQVKWWCRKNRKSL